MKKYGIRIKFLICFILMTLMLLSVSTTVLLIRLNSITAQRINGEFEDAMYENKINFNNAFSQISNRAVHMRFNAPLISVLKEDNLNDLERNKNISFVMENMGSIKTTINLHRDFLYVNDDLDITKNMMSYDVCGFSDSVAMTAVIFKSTVVEGSEWFKKAIENRGVPLVFLSDNSDAVYVATAIFDESIYNSRYLAVKVDAINCTELMNSMTVLTNYGQKMAFLDSENRIIYKTSGDIPDECYTEPIKGYKHISVKSDYGISIASVIPENDIAITFMQIRDVLWIYILATIIISFIFAYVISYVLTKPLVSLSETIKKTIILDNNGVPENKSHDEIGELHRSFEEMVEKNKSLIEKVEKEKELRREVEFQLYQTRINPHMVYNTLDSISWKALLAGQDEIAEMNRCLSEIYRYSIKGNVFMATLRDEIECIENYIIIQKYRYERKIVLKTDIPEKYCNIVVPKCILQPLVENSVIHGLNEKKTEDFIIEIKVSSMDGVCYISVSDNGCGIDAESINELLYHHDNTREGIKNVNERLKLKFGEDFELRYENNDIGGITATIAVPEDFGGKVV